MHPAIIGIIIVLVLTAVTLAITRPAKPSPFQAKERKPIKEAYPQLSNEFGKQAVAAGSFRGYPFKRLEVVDESRGVALKYAVFKGTISHRAMRAYARRNELDGIFIPKERLLKPAY